MSDQNFKWKKNGREKEFNPTKSIWGGGGETFNEKNFKWAVGS